jgi:hypothetical protein
MSKRGLPKTKLRRFRLYTYDLWRDPEGGLSVNDVYQQGVIEVRAKLHTFNPGTPYEFTEYRITDLQLNRALGARGLTWEGEDQYTLYASDKRGNPACELRNITEGD